MNQNQKTTYQVFAIQFLQSNAPIGFCGKLVGLRPQFRPRQRYPF